MTNLAKIHGKYQIQDDTINLEKLEKDFLFNSNWNINGVNSVKHTISTIPDPINDEDVANKRFVESFLPKASEISTITSDNLGTPGKLSFDDNHRIPGIVNVPNLLINDSFSNITDEDISISINKFINSGLVSIILNSKISIEIDLKNLQNNRVDVFTNSSIVFSDVIFEKFNGKVHPSLQSRTAELYISTMDMQKGYNELYIKQNNSTSNQLFWVYDQTKFKVMSEFSLGNFFGDIKYLSGVQYFTNAYFEIMFKIQNLFIHSYSNSENAIEYTCFNCEKQNESLPPINTFSQDLNEQREIKITTDRLIAQSASIKVSIDHLNNERLESDLLVLENLLIDQVKQTSTKVYENFDDEEFRIQDTMSIDMQSVKWNSHESLINNNGLLVYNGYLSYPKQNFKLIKNGPSNNVNYSKLQGNRTFLRYFQSEISRQNFVLYFECQETEFIKTVESIYDNKIWVEILAPTENNQLIWKDLITPYNGNVNDIGCSAQILGDEFPYILGGTFGTNDTSVTNLLLILKITASENWSGSISNIALTWL